MKIKLSKIKDTKPKRNHGDIKSLAESIKKEGLLQPLVINQNNELICGRRRFEAVKSLNWEDVNIYKINTNGDIDKFSKAIAENIMRLDLSWQEEVKAKEELDQLMREKYGSKPEGRPKNLSEYDQFWSQDKTAEILNQSRALITEDIQLSKALKEHPEIEKATTKSGAKMQLKKIKERKIAKNLKAPEGLFDVIVIDPPWDTGKWAAIGRRGATKYLEMDLEEIKKIILPANKDCVLWLWAINRYLHEAFHVLEAWEFEYKNCFTWVKDKFGLGDWGRGQTEHCLLATKGKPVVDFTNTVTVIYGDRREHSRKPEEFYKMVEKTCFGKKQEYFSRYKRKGWECYGAEI